MITVKAWFKSGMKVLEFESEEWALNEMKRVSKNNPSLKRWEFVEV